MVSRSVREFVDSVASAAEPVPAGGSVAAPATALDLMLVVLGDLHGDLRGQSHDSAGRDVSDIVEDFDARGAR